jgi:hypothetical protein
MSCCPECGNGEKGSHWKGCPVLEVERRNAEWKSSYDAKCHENTQNFQRAEAAEARCRELEDLLEEARVHVRFAEGEGMEIDGLDDRIDALLRE